MWTRTLTNDQAYFLGESRKGTSSGLIQLWMLLPADTWLEHHPVVSAWSLAKSTYAQTSTGSRSSGDFNPPGLDATLQNLQRPKWPTGLRGR